MQSMSPIARALPIVALALAASPARASEKLSLDPDPWTTLTFIVTFAVIVFPLNQLIFRPLLRVLDEREERIDGARKRADHMQAQAQEALDRYEDAIRTAYDEVAGERRRKLDVARAELTSITQQARSEAERDLSRAREELSASREAARASLRGSAEELAGLAAERILGRSLS